MSRDLLKMLLCLYCSVTFAAESTVLADTQLNTTNLSNSQIAKMFNLTVSDWKRYEEIKQGPAGFYNPNMNPVIMLGVDAKDAEEKARFAKIAAKNNHEYTKQTLEFQNAYRAAFNELYPDAKVFNIDALNTRPDKYIPKILDNVVLFVKANNCALCVKRYQELMQIPGIKLNIHFDTSDENAIFAWAKAQNVPRNLVKNRTITLNKLSSLNAQWGVRNYPTLLKKSPTDSQYQVVP